MRRSDKEELKDYASDIYLDVLYRLENRFRYPKDIEIVIDTLQILLDKAVSEYYSKSRSAIKDFN